MRLSSITAALAACLALGTTACAHASGENTLTGDWHGARTRLHEQGIDLSADYVGEWLRNTTGGTRDATAYADQIHLGAAFDFDKLWGWRGGSLHVDITNRNGHQLDARAGLGTLLETHEIYGAGNVTRLTRFDDPVRIRRSRDLERPLPRMTAIGRAVQAHRLHGRRLFADPLRPDGRSRL